MEVEPGISAVTSPRILNLTNVDLTEMEIELLSKGMSFCPTPPPNLQELTDDIYDFTRKLRLAYHFQNSDYTDTSMVRLPSTFTPSPNANAELERIIHDIEHMPISSKKVVSNMKKYKEALDLLQRRISDGEIIFKSADKGEVTTVMTPKFYHNMCTRELSKNEFYINVGDMDPGENIHTVVNDFAKKHKDTLTVNEFSYLTEKNYKIAYFYELPKLHKSDLINSVMETANSSYIHLKDFNGIIDGRPIVGGPSYHTSGLSEMVDILLEPVIHFIPHLLKDSFDFLNRVSLEATPDTHLITCDIKSLYTNISHDLAHKAIDFWTTATWDFIQPPPRFNKNFVLEALHIVLTQNFFYFCGTYWHQILGFAMGTKCAVRASNLIVAYLEEKMFLLLPTVYPHDLVLYFMKSYFRFLDDLFMKWLIGFDTEKLYKIFEELDPNLKFIFSELSKGANYLDISMKIQGRLINTSVYNKPTDSFNYLHYDSCHPKHTKDNIAISLAKRIIRITSDIVDKEIKLDDLKNHLMDRGHPASSINFAFTKVYTPKIEPEKKDLIIFRSTFNPKHVYRRIKIAKYLDPLVNRDMKE